MSFAHTSNLTVPALAAIAVLGAARWTCAQPLPCRYEVAAVIQAPPGPVGSSPTFGNAISPNGRYVVGSYRFDAVGADKAYYFDMQTQQFTPLPLLPGTFTSQAFDVNDAGQIAGRISIPAGDKGFVYSIETAQYTLLEPIHPQGVCEATGINSQGVVCGTRSIGSKSDPVFPKTAFIWSPLNSGTFLDLGVLNGPNSAATDIAEDGTVVGYTGGNFVSLFTRAYVWRQGTTTILPEVPNGFNSYAMACSSAGWVAIQGRVQLSPNMIRSFGYVDGNPTNLGVLPGLAGDNVGANDTNDSHVVVGISRHSPGLSYGFVWQSGAMRNLDELLAVTEPFHIDSGNAVAVGGRIATNAANQSGQLVTVVLDPVEVRGDAAPDCVVNVDDLISVILEWGELQSPADVTSDGIVDVDDLLFVIVSWTF